MTESWKGIDGALLERFGITHAPLGWRVPYFDREGTHYRTKLFYDEGDIRSKWLGEKQPQIPYGLWRLPEGGKSLILVEGESDTLAVATYLPRAAVLGVPGSQSWKPEWISILTSFERVFLSFDADLPNAQGKRPGRELTDRIMRDVSWARYVKLPDGTDTREFLQRAGKGPYLQLLKASEALYRISAAFRDAAPHVKAADRVRASWATEGPS